MIEHEDSVNLPTLFFNGMAALNTSEDFLFIWIVIFLEPTGQSIQTTEPVLNINSDSTSGGIANQAIIAMPIDNTSLSSSNTDSSKKSTDNLLS